MKKNIFKNYFYVCLLIVLACILAISLILIASSSRMYRENKFKEVANVADTYVGDIQAEYEKTGSINSDSMQKICTNFHTYFDVTLLIYDEYGVCVLCKDNKNANTVISEEKRKQLETGKYLELRTDKIALEQPKVTFGNRFYVSSPDGESFNRFYIMAYASVNEIDDFAFMLVLICVTMSLLIAVVAGFVLSRCSKRMTRQINEISRITDKYAKGDFSEQIKVNGSKEMRHFASALNEMAEFMKTSDDVSKSFIANVSHELRTPMTTIGGFVDGILDGTIPKSKQGQYLILVSQEIKRLRILVTSMLNMTRFESGTMQPNFTELNLTDTVISTVLMFEKKIESKNIEIEGLDSDRLVAIADKDLIQQVIYNLVENAVKFVNDNGTISFSFSEMDKFCYVSIRNTGEGLENDEIPQVFDRFYKTDSSRGKDTTGLGLGLAISRKIVNLHNGQIIVKSVKDEYTEFTIKIPVKQ